ncbi:MAG: response regulator [Nitrospirota bacterium]
MILPKILFVDDEEDFSLSIKNFLETNDFKVTSCLTTEEAALRLGSEFFDIVICDVFMPFFGTQEGGLEIARIVAEKYPASYTVIISQYVTETLVNRFMETVPHKRYCFLNKTKDLENKLIEVIKKGLERKYIFVCMPFHEDFQDIYLFGIKAASIELGFNCERADEIQYTGGIIDKIYDLIKSAHVIVADMTGRNPNVFYEVGYAHALDKEVILLTQDTKDIPVDLRKFVHIVYGGKIAKLKNELKKHIEAIYK